MKQILVNALFNVSAATNVDGASIEFIAHGYADIYDLDAFETYVENLYGYFYDEICLDIEPEQMQMLYNAIFSECEYKLRICAAYTADMRTGLQALKDYVFPDESKTYFPNPHIQLYGCIGDYEGLFQEYMHKRDWIMCERLTKLPFPHET